MRSRLEPHLELIRALRRKRFPYRKIASILKEHYQLETSKSAIHDFLKVRRNQSQAASEPVALAPPPQSHVLSDPSEGSTIGTVPSSHAAQSANQADVYARMEELKRRKRVPPPPPPKPRFHYEEGEPLRLINPNPTRYKKD